MSDSQAQSARYLKKLLEQLMYEQCGCLSLVSEVACRDVIIHHERDLNRLRVIHPQGIHPAKHIGYLVFWVRKLKPIAITFRIADIANARDKEIPDGREVAPDNEIVSVYLAQHLLFSYIDDGIIPEGPVTRHKQKLFKLKVEMIIKYVLNQQIDVGSEMGNAFEAFVYDMRYRTFGPHHVVHFVNHIIHAASAIWKKG